MSEEESCCDCCMFETNKLTRYNLEHRAHLTATTEERERGQMLCRFCAFTFISNLKNYFEQYPNGIPQLGKALAYIGNAIIEEVRKEKKK